MDQSDGFNPGPAVPARSAELEARWNGDYGETTTLRRAKFVVTAGKVYFTSLPVMVTVTPKVSGAQTPDRVEVVSTTKSVP